MRATCCEEEVHQAALFATWGRDLDFVFFFCFLFFFATWGEDLDLSSFSVFIFLQCRAEIYFLDFFSFFKVGWRLT